ncbi:MAG: ribosome-binding factor A [Acidimicrobiia bacterium]|nr:ribosome-binding factor A [Acidimicrobiia bacterium]
MAGKSRSQRSGGSGRSDGRSGRGRGGSGAGGRSRSKRPAINRQYPRTARLNTLLQEIVADFFERVDDDRFEMLTVTGVEVDNDLNRAQVFVSALGGIPLSTPDPADGGDASTPAADSDADPDRELLDALADYRKPVQAKIGREARIRKTPEVVFVIDPAVRSGARIDQILAAISPSGPDPTDAEPESGPDPADDVPADETTVTDG